MKFNSTFFVYFIEDFKIYFKKYYKESELNSKVVDIVVLAEFNKIKVY